MPSSLTMISSLSESLSFAQLTVMVPIWVNLIALFKTFENACRSLSLSPLTNSFVAMLATIDMPAGIRGLNLYHFGAGTLRESLLDAV